MALVAVSAMALGIWQPWNRENSADGVAARPNAECGVAAQGPTAACTSAATADFFGGLVSGQLSEYGGLIEGCAARISNMPLSDFAQLSVLGRQCQFGFAEFREFPTVAALRWPDDVLEQWLYDHGANESFLEDYAYLDLQLIRWNVEIVPTEAFLETDRPLPTTLTKSQKILITGFGFAAKEFMSAYRNVGMRTVRGNGGRSSLTAGC